MWYLYNTQPINNRITVFSAVCVTFIKKYRTFPTHFWTVLLCVDSKGLPYSWSYCKICLVSFIMDWIIGHLNIQQTVGIPPPRGGREAMLGQALLNALPWQWGCVHRTLTGTNDRMEEVHRVPGGGCGGTRAVVSGAEPARPKPRLITSSNPCLRSFHSRWHTFSCFKDSHVQMIIYSCRQEARQK